MDLKTLINNYAVLCFLLLIGEVLLHEYIGMDIVFAIDMLIIVFGIILVIRDINHARFKSEYEIDDATIKLFYIILSIYILKIHFNIEHNYILNYSIFYVLAIPIYLLRPFESENTLTKIVVLVIIIGLTIPSLRNNLIQDFGKKEIGAKYEKFNYTTKYYVMVKEGIDGTPFKTKATIEVISYTPECLSDEYMPPSEAILLKDLSTTKYESYNIHYYCPILRLNEFINIGSEKGGLYVKLLNEKIE